MSQLISGPLDYHHPLLLRAMGNGCPAKLVDNAIVGRKTGTTAAQYSQEATGSVDGAVMGSTNKSSPHTEAEAEKIYEMLKRVVEAQRKERENTKSTDSDIYHDGAAEFQAADGATGEAVGSLNLDRAAAESPAVDGAAALDKAAEEVAAEKEAAEVDDSKKFCWLCCKPEHAVELRICSGCHTVK